MNKNGQHSPQKKSKFQTTMNRFRSEVWTKRETLCKELGQFPLF